MASFSLNCFSNSYSCKVNTDMFIGADLRSRYVFSTQNKIICKALGFKCYASPTRPPGLPLAAKSRRSLVSPNLSATSRAEYCLSSSPALGLSSSPRPSASTVGGNECLAVLVPARLSITLFTSLQGNLLPLVRLEKLTLCEGERERETSPALGAVCLCKGD